MAAPRYTIGVMAKKMSIEELARITAKGFDGVHGQIGGVQGQISEVKSEMSGLRSEMKKGFDRIENLLLRDHLNRIERLEDTVLRLKVKVGIR